MERNTENQEKHITATYQHSTGEYVALTSFIHSNYLRNAITEWKSKFTCPKIGVWEITPFMLKKACACAGKKKEQKGRNQEIRKLLLFCSLL